MKLQNYEIVNESIKSSFDQLRKRHPERFRRRLELSWSNWGFGMEPLEASASRLAHAGIRYMELHGNHYGPDLGYDPKQTADILQAHGLSVSGICGMFSKDNDLSSRHAHHRQAALDYLKRELEFASIIGGDYLLVVPGAVGRPQPYDDMEFARSAETLRLAGDWFVRHGVKAAIEPIRSAEVSLVHTIADARRYMEEVNHPGIAHINADVYHMLTEERHIGEALLVAKDQLVNLHLADSNRRALGEGCLDLDTIIRTLYLMEFNRPGCYVTPEPLGPGGDPYPAMYGRPDAALLDAMVGQTAAYFREREACLLEDQE